MRACCCNGQTSEIDRLLRPAVTDVSAFCFGCFPFFAAARAAAAAVGVRKLMRIANETIRSIMWRARWSIYCAMIARSITTTAADAANVWPDHIIMKVQPGRASRPVQIALLKTVIIHINMRFTLLIVLKKR